MSDKESQGESQKLRWFKYGSNVAVMIAATLVIVIFVNWIVAKRLPEWTKGRAADWVRYDLTSTRQYSLSPQTRAVIKRLDQDVQITLLYAKDSESSQMFNRIEDLLAEYKSRSAHILLDQIDPTTDKEHFEKFSAKLLERYSGQVTQAKAELSQAKLAYDSVRQFTAAQATALSDATSKVSNQDQQIADLFIGLSRFFTRAPQQLKLTEAQTKIDDVLKQKLPDFATARGEAAAPLATLAATLGKAATACGELADADGVSAPVKELLLGFQAEYQKKQKSLSEQITKLNKIETKGYEDVRAKIEAGNSIVISLDLPAEKQAAEDPKAAAAADTKSASADGDRGVVVLGLNEVFFLQANRDKNEVQPEQGYKGEEAITGALLRLKLKHHTKIVFINPFQAAVLEPGAPMSYDNVASVLRKMNFEVVEWQPGGGGMGPNGPSRPQPKPVAEPGQKMIFIALPPPPASPQQPFNPASAAVAGAVKEQLDAGQPIMIFTLPSSMMSLGQPEPIVEMLKPFGVNVQTTRLVLAAPPGQGARTQATSQITLDNWPDTHPISKAVGGLRGISIQGLPIDIPAKPPEGVQIWPLARTNAETWSDNEFTFSQRNGVFAPTPGTKRDPADPAGPFTIAAAVAKGDQRIVVISDFIWGVDALTRSGPTDMFGQPLYSAYPANAELFVNSVYWLAGLDDLIAPGSRSRDVRRIGAVSPPALKAIWWAVLLGMPLAMLAMGTIVWTIRRK